MRSCRHALLVATLSSGATAAIAMSIAGPAAALGLPVPVPTIGPVRPAPTVPPVPRPTASVPTVPGVPLPTKLPGLPHPVLPALPGLPGLAGPPHQAAPPHRAAPPAAAFGYLPFGHYVDDGLGSAGASTEPYATATFTLPPDLPYDKTGFDQTIYPLRSAAHAGPHRVESLGSRAVHDLTSHLLLDAFAALAVGGVGLGVVVARRRGLLGG